MKEGFYYLLYCKNRGKVEVISLAKEKKIQEEEKKPLNYFPLRYIERFRIEYIFINPSLMLLCKESKSPENFYIAEFSI